MTAPHIALGAINLEAHDPTALADLWASVTGATPSPGGDSVYLPPAAANGFGMFFRPLYLPHHRLVERPRLLQVTKS
ncbi:hypothetical protein [Cryobacterium sp. GrIS_2_6]|uniref:hypothetical protein n=1 Tax=Cryobacterium sp. GrIS_2_6 TaxID=3162785 RepID=UPI002E024080|nr:hypothetical protein [Cryobacterium psychrotolerans]